MTFGAPVPAFRFETWNDRRLEVFVAFVPTTRGKFGQCGREAVHRVIRQLGIGNVPLHAVYGELAGERPAPSNFQHVATVFQARGFTDDAPVDRGAPRQQRFDHSLRAVDRRAFFVAGDQECDRAAMSGRSGRRLPLP